jgi:DNA repair exonuclease SbcCD ATPase subunit
MKQLLVERAKRERELELLRTSEPTIMAELADLRAKMGRMRSEMEAFGDIERMRRQHEATMQRLGELKQAYIRRRDTMRQQVGPSTCSQVLCPWSWPCMHIPLCPVCSFD